MEAYADPLVNFLTCRTSAQSGKTLQILCLLCWQLAEDPCNLLWVCANTEEAKKIAKNRIWPMFESCEPIEKKLPTDKTKRLTTEAYMPGSFFVVCGATSKHAVQSTAFKALFLDECRSYPPGRLAMILKRVRSFGRSAKVAMISTPHEVDDEMDISYQSGDQNQWHVKCRHCGGYFHLDQQWKCFKYDIKKDDDGNILFDETCATARVECSECGEKYWDVPADRKHISRNGKWVQENPGAPRNHRSYSWSSLLPYWSTYESVLTEYLKAKAALALGDIAPMKDHITETRGLSWSLDYAMLDVTKKMEPFLHDYDPVVDPIEWEVEPLAGKSPTWRRFLICDYQAKGGRHFVHQCWSVGAGGRLRLLDYGRYVNSADELSELATRWEVQAADVVIDCAWGTSDIYSMHMSHGFTPFRGVNRETFEVGHGLKQVFKFAVVDPEIGTAGSGRVFIKVFQIAKPSALAMANQFLSGEAGEIQVMSDVPKQFQSSICAYERRKKVNSATGVAQWAWYDKTLGRNDHDADCFACLLVVAKACDLL
jgi:hypothetical protein